MRARGSSGPRARVYAGLHAQASGHAHGAVCAVRVRECVPGGCGATKSVWHPLPQPLFTTASPAIVFSESSYVFAAASGLASPVVTASIASPIAVEICG